MSNGSVITSSTKHRRSCDGCTACCTVMHVSSIGKQPGRRCVHERGFGCAIYPTRPDQCKSEFYCLWVRDDGRALPEMARPDRIGIVFTDMDDGQGGRAALAAREVWSDAAHAPHAGAVIEQLRNCVPVHVISARPPSAVTLTIHGEALHEATPWRRAG